MVEKVPISNAFSQGRTLHLSNKVPIGKQISKLKKDHIPMKRVAGAAQAAANINERNPTAYKYYTKLAKVARYIGHKQQAGKYSLKYPKSSIKAYTKEGEKAATQAKLKV